MLERLHAVFGHAHLVALHPQGAFEHLRDRVVILDHQDAGLALVFRHRWADGRATDTPRAWSRSAGRRSGAAVEATCSDMATSQKRKPTKRKPPPKRASRSLLASRPSLPQFHLEPHHVDILALALIAIGVFLGGVAYLHWGGGALGEGAVRATKFAFGAVGYAVPAALVAAGGLILSLRFRDPARVLQRSN